MLKFLPLVMPAINVIEGAIDSIRDKVEPVEGSVVYCDLAFGYAEHSGVYVGNNQIVHLNGQGNVELVSPRQFIRNTTALSIYVSCRDNYAVGSDITAHRARQALNDSRNYSFLLDNCHQFAAGCITGSFDNPSNFLALLKHECEQHFRTNTWRKWDIDF